MIDRDGKGEIIASDNFIINDIPFHISLLLEKYKKKEKRFIKVDNIIYATYLLKSEIRIMFFEN